MENIPRSHQSTPTNDIRYDETLEDCCAPKKRKIAWKQRRTKKSLFASPQQHRLPGETTWIRRDIERLFPLVFDKLQREHCLLDFKNFLMLLHEDKFPLNNLSFRLFLDSVKWYSTTTTTGMRYSADTIKFWKTGYRLLGEKFLLLMGGPKNEGQLISGHATRGSFDPTESTINFAVPSRSILCDFNKEQFPTELKPGIIDQSVRNADSDKDYIICVDGKKLVPGVNDQGGDIDLFGHEPHTTANSDRVACENEIKQIEASVELLKNISGGSSSMVRDNVKQIVRDLSVRLSSIRTIKRKQELTLDRLSEKTKPEHSNPYAYAISSIRAYLHMIASTISKSLDVIGNIARYSSMLDGSSDFVESSILDRSSQRNWIGLKTPPSLPTNNANNPRFTQQRTEEWHELRNTFKITGSTIHNSLGLRTLKEQKIHFDKVFYGKEESFSEEVLARMSHGTQNECHAVSTLTGVVLPFLYPKLVFVEAGAFPINSDASGRPLVLVSPDGLLCEKFNMDDDPNRNVIYACEIKCPTPSKFTTQIYYKIPDYYVCQILAEMAAVGADRLIFMCYTEQSSTVFEVLFDCELFSMIMDCGESLYLCEHPKRPTRKSEFVPALKEKIGHFTDENVTFIGEFPSRKLLHCIEIVQSPAKSPYTFASPESEQPLGVPSQQAVESLTTTLDKAKECTKNLFNLCRRKATEVVVWLLQDVDREWDPERPHSVPIAYALKVYSLSCETMRAMTESVLASCSSNSKRIIGMSFDGQWVGLLNRDTNNQPLTLLQLQKEVWNKAKKKTKTSSNLVEL